MFSPLWKGRAWGWPGRWRGGGGSYQAGRCWSWWARGTMAGTAWWQPDTSGTGGQGSPFTSWAGRARRRPFCWNAARGRVPRARGEEDQDLAVLGCFLATAHVVLDALLGTGRFRPLEGLFKAVLEKVEEEKKKRPGLKLIALDLPS